MPQHVRSIECCYCGASAIVNLKNTNENSLKCGECGARMAIGKMEHISSPKEYRPLPNNSKNTQRNLLEQWQGESTNSDKSYGKKKKKKKKSLFSRLEDIIDDVTDIFD